MSNDKARTHVSSLVSCRANCLNIRISFYYCTFSILCVWLIQRVKIDNTYGVYLYMTVFTACPAFQDTAWAVEPVNKARYIEEDMNVNTVVPGACKTLWQ